jgi:uncharacterized membrane protein YtjA (UPF0391 family)
VIAIEIEWLLSFGGIAGGAASIAKILSVVFLVLFVLSLILGVAVWAFDRTSVSSI